LYVVSAAYFANANNNGNCNYNNASNEAGVRPVAGLLDFTTAHKGRDPVRLCERKGHPFAENCDKY